MESSTKPHRFNSLDHCVDSIIEQTNGKIVLGLPLGLGKANHIANSLYLRAQADSSLQLSIITALTLQVPTAGSDLQSRFLGPIISQRFSSYPELFYVQAQRENTVPSNIEIREFFFQTATNLDNPVAQQNYVSSNYTHAIRDLVERGVNVIAQLLAIKDGRLSLSCNPDITRALLRKRAAKECNFLLAGQVNSALPFMYNDAELESNELDFLLQGEKFEFPLFAPPNRPVSTREYALALHVSSLVKDGGTLQIGIGALGDAVSHALGMRHRQNQLYQDLFKKLTGHIGSVDNHSDTGCFEQGLYGCSEMLVTGFLHLRACGVLKRRVYDNLAIQSYVNEFGAEELATAELLRHTLEHYYNGGGIGRGNGGKINQQQFTQLQRAGLLHEHLTWSEEVLFKPGGIEITNDFHDEQNFDLLCEQGIGKELNGRYMHAAFFLGSSALYQQLSQMDEAEARGINMTDVEFINQLYGEEQLKRLQRLKGSFVNTALMVTLTGAVVSDTLEGGKVISGVGGQYNFIAMAAELKDAHSIIAVPSTRLHHGKLQSNIVWEYSQTTIPRHLRDIVVTEYGVARLRGKSDRDVICAMLAICDSRFQQALLQQAKAAGKIESSYGIPKALKKNLPKNRFRFFSQQEIAQNFPHFPFDCDYSDVEAELLLGLQLLKQHQGKWRKMVSLYLQSWYRFGLRKKFTKHMNRMDLDSANGFSERASRRLLLVALAKVRAQKFPLRPLEARTLSPLDT